MGVPTYLTVSRHSVYYLRWPLPQSLHPQGKASDVKVSLRTRDRREALRLSQHLGYIAKTLTLRAVSSKMRYDEMRAVIKRHFKSLLEKKKDEIGANGRLGAYDLSVLASSLSVAEMPVGEELYEGQSQDRDGDLRRFQALHGLSLDQGSHEYRMLATEFQRGYRDYVKAVLDYDRSFDGFAFDGGVAANPPGSAAPASVEPVTPLKEMVERYLEEGELGNQWGAKTLGERYEQFALLQEIVGAEINARSITPATARKVKEIIMRYPKNRNKGARTRGLDLKAALMIEGVDAISVRTMNVYLHTYNALFKWAKRNDYVRDNVFSGMTVKGKPALVSSGAIREPNRPRPAMIQRPGGGFISFRSSLPGTLMSQS